MIYPDIVTYDDNRDILWVFNVKIWNTKCGYSQEQLYIITFFNPNKQQQKFFFNKKYRFGHYLKRYKNHAMKYRNI